MMGETSTEMDMWYLIRLVAEDNMIVDMNI